MSYAEMLRDPRWQKMRLRRMDAADWKCERCGTSTVPLNVHHKKYVKGRAPWEYENADLQVLCENCHRFVHQFFLLPRKKSEELIALALRLREKVIFRYKIHFTDGSAEWAFRPSREHKLEYMRAVSMIGRIEAILNKRKEA